MSNPQGEQRVELTGENALTVAEARHFRDAMQHESDRPIHTCEVCKAVAGKLDAALSQHTTPEEGSK